MRARKKEIIAGRETINRIRIESEENQKGTTTRARILARESTESLPEPPPTSSI